MSERTLVKTNWPVYLSASEIEKEFVLAAVHLKQIVVLDPIERVVEPPGFRILSHDLWGPLREIRLSSAIGTVGWRS